MRRLVWQKKELKVGGFSHDIHFCLTHKVGPEGADLQKHK
jgi:hypothetical protein